jgi:hypothetical protein
MRSIHRSTSARALTAGAASLAFMMMGAGGARADTVIGADGTPGSICQGDDLDCVINGSDGESVGATGNPAVAVGGNGGAAGFGPMGFDGSGDGDGDGGRGGSATAVATGGSIVSASATGGAGGSEDTGFSGSGGQASATSTAMGGSGGASSSAYATGGFAPPGGGGGFATATANAFAARGGLAASKAVATGGEQQEGIFSVPGGANSTSSAKSTFAGAGVRSTDEAVADEAVASTATLTGRDGVATANAFAQAGGADESFVTPDNSAYAFSTVLPNKADVATLIGGASNVASAFLGPRDMVFGTAILGNNDFPDGPFDSFTFSESSSFDFSYGGDLLLGVIDGDFSVIINGVQVLAENFVEDGVINLGSSFGPNIDLTIVSYGSGDFVLGGAVPEPSTWAMLMLGFVGLGVVGYRQTRWAKPGTLGTRRLGTRCHR